jgi:hypothetical protein
MFFESERKGSRPQTREKESEDGAGEEHIEAFDNRNQRVLVARTTTMVDTLVPNPNSSAVDGASMEVIPPSS